MAITHLTVENFKSFGKAQVDLRSFNTVVGSNASGKSNFVQILQFLRDVKTHGLEDAFTLHGGVKVIRNFNLDMEALLRFVIETDDVGQFAVRGEDASTFGLRLTRPVCEFAVRMNKRGEGFRVVEDEIRQEFEVFELEEDDTDGEKYRLIRDFWTWERGRERAYKTKGEVGTGLFSYRRKGSAGMAYSVELPSGLPIDREKTFPFSTLSRMPYPNKSLLLESPFLTICTGWLFRDLHSVAVYDLDAKKSKSAVPMTGAKELNGDGGNLAIVLRDILNRPEDRRKFLNLLSDLLPFLSEVNVDLTGPGALLTKADGASHNRPHDLYATWASDGTMSVVALISGNVFRRKKDSDFEESDRNIHPHIIRKIIQMMKEASRDKQIILTTHNPEMLRHMDLGDIVLVSRDSEGCSQITRPANSEVIRNFIDSELGVNELFVDNLLTL